MRMTTRSNAAADDRIRTTAQPAPASPSPTGSGTTNDATASRGSGTLCLGRPESIQLNRMNPIKAIRTALAFTKAGNAIDDKDFAAAKFFLDKAKALLGRSIDWPASFEVHLRAAYADQHLGNVDSAAKELQNAASGISRHRGLNEIDRAYLLDYCDICTAIMRDDESAIALCLGKDDYAKVSRHYRRLYPLSWDYGDPYGEAR